MSSTTSRVSPARPPRDRAAPPTDLRGWRELLLRGMLYAAAVLGLPAAISGSLTAIRDGQLNRIVLFGASYLIVLALALGRGFLPYRLRAYVLLLITASLGINALVSTGLAGSGRIFLFAFCTIATLLLGLTAGVVSLLLCVGTMAVVAWAITSGQIVIAPELMSGGDS